MMINWNMWRSNALPLYNTAMATRQEKVTNDDQSPGNENKVPQANRKPEYLAHSDHQESDTLLRENRDLAVLYAIAGHLNRKIDVHEALQEVLAQVTKLLGLQTGWVWLLDEQDGPYLAAAQSLPPYLADHPQRMTGSCLCLDTFLQGDLEGAANINVLRCSRLKNAERENDPSSLAQGMAAITLQLETADALAASKPERAQEAIHRALNLARKNLEEARRSVID